MKKIIIYLLLVANTVLFAQELQVGEKHKGILNLKGGYQIFPENRIGNSLYGKDGDLLKNYPKKIIVNAFDYEGYLFFITEDENKSKQIIYQNPNIQNIKFIAANYIQFTQDQEILFLRMHNDKLEKINIPYKSARGFSYNQKDTLAFYRITRYIPPDPETEKKSIFILQISILKDDNQEIIDIANSFESVSRQATLQWVSEKKIAFSLREGIKEIFIP